MNAAAATAARGKKPVRLAVLVSGGGRTLLNFLGRIAAGDLAAEVVRVVASSECPAAERARQAGLDVKVVARGDFVTLTPTAAKEKGAAAAVAVAKRFSDALTEAVGTAGPELVALAGFLHLWQFPSEYAGRVMNIHPALLPSFGGHGMYGHRVHEAVIAEGCKVSGCTVHFCDLRYDTGPIIVQRSVPVLEGDTPDDLAARVFEQECIAYTEAINLFAAGRLRVEGRVVHVLPA